MSWLLNPHGDPPIGPPAFSPGAQNGAAGTAPHTDEDKLPKVPDLSNANGMVSTKKANRPFLAYKEYRDKREAEHKSWEQRMKERDEMIAKGLKVGPKEKDPTEEVEFFTGSFLWEYEGKWTNLKTYMPTNQRLFSERLLAEFDGSVENKPIYVAIDHDVYDVSNNRRTYGPGGSYHHMAGVDAARSFATGCFATHRTHDIRGLTASELSSLEHWKRFFADHKTYFKVGKVVHPPIDPASPIPEHCDPKKGQDLNPKKNTNDDKVMHPDPSSDNKPVDHEDL